MHDEHVGRAAEIGDVGEIAHRIEPGVLGVHRRRQHVGRHARRHQRVAVGLAARHRLGTDETAAAGAVLDEELLPEGLTQLLREYSRQQVVSAARRIGDHDAHRLRRPIGRWRSGDGKESGEGEGRERSVKAFHRLSHVSFCWRGYVRIC